MIIWKLLFNKKNYEMCYFKKNNFNLTIENAFSSSFMALEMQRDHQISQCAHPEEEKVQIRRGPSAKNHAGLINHLFHKDPDLIIHWA